MSSTAYHTRTDQRRRRGDPFRDPRRVRARTNRRVPVPRQNTWVLAPTAGRRIRLLRRRPGAAAPARDRLESDHPEVLVGPDQAPTPVEYLLHAIAACLTAGIVNIASARGVS